MEKRFALLLAFVMLFAMAACERAEPQTTHSTESETRSTVSTQKETGSTTAAEKETGQVEKQDPATMESREPIQVPFTPIYTVEDYFDLYDFTPPDKAGSIQYLFHEPIRDTGNPYPLVIYLHSRGDTVNEHHMGTAAPLVNSLIDLENNSELYSTYTLVPITPTSDQSWWEEWQFHMFRELIPDLIKNYNIDAKRVYVTGISMGGYTTCRLVNYMPPGTFAAAVPLSGAYDLIKPDAFLDTAFRIYHSAKDSTVNVSCARSLYRQLGWCKHPNAEYIEYPDGNHMTPLSRVYNDPSFYKWLFAQRLP